MNMSAHTAFEPLALSRDDFLFVLTGAGISAESGLQTFRDAGGLWEGHDVQEVATPEAWHRNPELVWRFYAMRRQQARSAEPNAAHRALASLEARLGERFFLCTQNVDDLHERGGATRVTHMHGALAQSRLERTPCASCPFTEPFADSTIYESLDAVPSCDCGHRLRPHICWFGEVPFEMDLIAEALDRATVFVTIGSSGAVYPAAGFVRHARSKSKPARCIYVGLETPDNAESYDECRLGTATSVVPELFAT